jgi:exonuclease SbcD
MRIAAFGDCHIGSYGKKIDQETGLNARLLDMTKALRFVTRDAEEQGADAILFAGDMFRTSKPSPTELVMAKNALIGCYSQLPIYAIPGNHDLPRSKGDESAVAPIDRINGLMVFNQPYIYHHSNRGENEFQLVTLPYPNRAQLAAVLPDYDKLSPEEADKLVGAHVETILHGMAAQIDTSKPSILLAHLSIDAAEVGVERSIMAGRDITIPLHAIPEEFTFAAFGHIHKAQDFGTYGRPNVFYTGSTDRIDFGEEQEEKSYVMMDLDAGTWERIPIPCRKYRTFRYWAFDDQGDAWAGELDAAKDAICRVEISRPDTFKPDYALLQREIEDAGCFDFRGFTEDVQRIASVRSEEIVKAQTLDELLGVWHESKSCQIPLNELVSAGSELERKVL